MTRKNYISMAKILNSFRGEIMAREDAKGASIPFDALVSRMCVECKDDNPYFDSAKFRAAVYK